MHSHSRLIFHFLIAFGVNAHAAPIEYIQESYLVDPPSVDAPHTAYQNLDRADRWKLKMNGLRFSALEPEVWAPRAIDITENKNLVSIRPFFLRASESPDYQVKSIALKFSFKQRSHKQISLQPQTHTSILDIGFGGRYVPSLPASTALIDSSYVLRLSGRPGRRSGLYFKTGNDYHLIEKSKKRQLKTGTVYEFNAQVTHSRLVAYLNGKPFLEYQKNSIAKGLVSLQSGWNPIKLTALRIDGSMASEAVSHSGLSKLTEKS